MVDCVNGFVFVVGFLIGMRCIIALHLYWVTGQFIVGIEIWACIKIVCNNTNSLARLG